MTVDASVNAVAYALLSGIVSLLAYLPIAAFYFIRHALMKIDISCTEFSLSLLIMTGFVASVSFRSGSEGPDSMPNGFVVFYYCIIFITSLGILVSDFFKLFSEEKEAFRRLLATQGVLGAMFMAMLGWLFMIDVTFDVAISYLLIVAIMAVAAAMNFMIHVRDANFSRSRASVLQGAAMTVAVIASCCWIIIFDWYGFALICFYICIWTVQLTWCLEKIASRSSLYVWIIHILLIAWIFMTGSISFRTSEPWLS